MGDAHYDVGKMWAKFKQKIRRAKKTLFIAPAIAALVIGVRMTGLLQSLELSALDQFFLLRPAAEPDDRIVILGVDEQDLRYVGKWPIPDGVLAELLKKVRQQQPKAIGLDIYRDIPVQPGHEKLVQVFQTTPNLIGISKIVGEQVDQIPAPPALSDRNQFAANDFPYDVDGKVRRAFLYLSDKNDENVFSLGFQLALMYLKDLGIHPKMIDEQKFKIQLGQALFTPFRRNDGGYVWAADEGYQILLNYRGPQGFFQTVSLRDVLNDKISPTLMRDRIVIIGSTAISVKDVLLTPYSTRLFDSLPHPMPGVEVHANVTSHFISAALDGRSLLQTWPEAIEWIWIFFWSLIGATVTCQWRSDGNLNKILIGQTSIIIPITSLALILLCYIAFLRNWWIPLVSPLLTLIGSTTFKIGYTLWENLLLSHKQLEEYARTLEIKVEERTQELKDKNYALEQTLQKLQAAQKQIIAQEKLAYLGSLTAGIAHEIRNPLNFINNFAQISGELTEELVEEIKAVFEETENDSVDPDEVENIYDMLTDLKDSVADIESHGKRIETIIQSMMMHTPTQKGHREMTNINLLLSESIELAYNSYLAKGNRCAITLATDYDEAIREIEVIPQDMARAFVNIIKNACDAVSDRQKALGEKFQPMISVKTRNQDEAITISIQDNGIGIPPEIVDKIFNPFFTTKPPGEGTGLGLSLTYDTIVGEHQGDIKVKNDSEASTEFIIVIPKKSSSNL
ncbi:CHASE2 domain-containing protein [Planktothricoides raciborskii]|uniref:histidine kinase n=2 Tax=Planktothricoides raciborskii TaxID=132608 RepID=A0AAU8JLV7_9CYAN